MNCPQCGMQVTAAGVPGKRIGKIMIAMIFAGIGIVGVCGFVVPSLIGGIQPTRQKRTIGDMKTLVTAIESYHSDKGYFPPGSDINGLCQALSPDYLVTCSRTDDWYSDSTRNRREFAYASWGGSPAGCPGKSVSPGKPASAASTRREVTQGEAPAGQPACGPAHYGLASAGKDGKYAMENFSGYGIRETDRYEDDIVLMDGEFIRAPQGKQNMAKSGDQYDHPTVAAPDEFNSLKHGRVSGRAE